MTASDLRRFLRELDPETRLDFRFGEVPLALLMLGRYVDRAELTFAGSEDAPGATENDPPAGETPATHE